MTDLRPNHRMHLTSGRREMDARSQVIRPC
jgi:hypothetical protein